jgi:glycosyltransferase involved in cell wall biosynthesis
MTGTGRRRIAIAASEILGMRGCGGAGTADSLLAAALGRAGHPVELLVAPGRDVEVSADWAGVYADAGVRVRALDDRPEVSPAFLRPAWAVDLALRDQPPDVLVADDWRALSYLALQARRLGVAYTDTAFVLHCHGPARVLAEFARKVPDTVDRVGEEVCERSCIELADAVVSPSGWLLGWMREHGWPVPGSARVVHHVRQSTALGTAAPRQPTGEPVRRLAFFGQIREGKGIRIFLDALELLEPEALDGMELLFLGRPTPRWDRARIERSLAAVRERLAGVRIEAGLSREEALEELRVPGTLAIMPSLLDNAPNTVVECIEHGIPFVACRTGGIPELVAEEDRERVLCSPTAADLAAALTRALAEPDGFAPAGPPHDPTHSLETWLELVAAVKPARPEPVPAARGVTLVGVGRRGAAAAARLASSSRSVEVEAVRAESRASGLARASAEWIVFLDDDDSPLDDMVEALVAAQSVSDADVVTTAVRPAGDPGGMHLFLGDPGPLGLVENHYGVLGLVRRSLLTFDLPDAVVDPDWPLFAQLALAGARVVSLPEPVSVHSGQPGRTGDVPGEGLQVLDAFEERDGQLAGFPQLAAALAASLARVQRTTDVDGSRPTLARRAARRLRAALGRGRDA